MTALADAVVSRLQANGVDVVFGIPGTHNLELFRALRGAGIRVVDAHHEQGLGYAADGWSRVTGRQAVVVTTTGPGITNLVTALATSASASVPVLAIAPGVPEAVHGRGTGWLHDLPSQVETLATVARSCRADSVGEATAFIDAVFDDGGVARCGASYLELPVDLLDGAAAGEASAASAVPDARAGSDASVPVAETDALRAAAAVMAEAARPAIVVGRGGCGPRAARAIRELAEALGAPVLTTSNAKGVLDEAHPLAIGVALRLEGGRMLLADADRVLVVGSDLGTSEFWGPCTLRDEQVVRVDIEEDGLVANVTPEWMLRGDAERIVPALLAEVTARTGTTGVAPELPYWAVRHLPAMAEQVEREGGSYRRFHEIMVEEIAATVPSSTEPDVVVAGDSSQATYLGSAYYWPLGRPNRFLYPAGYGTLGYAVPAAIGAALAGAADRVVAITGEGGLMFSVQELATAARLGLAIPVVVFSNGGFREIRDGMVHRGIEPTAVDFAAPDFALLARAFGADGERVDTAASFRDAFRRALAATGPYVIEVALRG